MKPIYFVCVLLCLATAFAARPVHAQTETVLYSFTGGSDGGGPQSRLTSDGAGNFYGTTFEGGVGNFGVGYGTVFELSPNGSGGWNETVLYSFKGGEDGANPSSPVIFDSAGNLYGTTGSGGIKGNGVVFELSRAGKKWKEAVLHKFIGTDGANPAGGLIMDAAANLYGTTQNGPAGTAIVFELSRSGGTWTEQVIYTIDQPLLVGLPNGLTMDAARNIFGSTLFTVFELSPDGLGAWNPIVLHTFTGGLKDGAYARGTLVLDQAGNLYGTAAYGGAYGQQIGGYGTVYKLSHGRKGWTEKILYFFKGGPNDGYGPAAGIVFDQAGNIYGTTANGGEFNLGTVFELVTPVGKGSHKEKVLWSFNGPDGFFPFSSLMLDDAGDLYGTTIAGGSTDQGGSSGNGVVFMVAP